MLPKHRRVHHSGEFGSVIRSGGRAASASVVVHVSPGRGPSRAGVIVGKAVGGSVVRHRVARRLRHCLAPILPDLPEGTLVVVRALPPAAGASSIDLSREVANGIRRASARVGRRPGSRAGESQ